MDLILAFLIFGVALTACMWASVPLSVALLCGLLAFFMVGLHRGFSAETLCKMIYRSRKTSLLVCQILFFIGCLTALWRASGTIAYFVYYGIHMITPHLFILIAFLLSAALSLALGSSFGTVGTAGVMLMILARSGNVDLLVTAGAVLSGAYVGERCAPTSSAVLLISAVTGADHRRLLKDSIRTGLLPFALTTILFAVLSWYHPIQHVDSSVVNALQNSYVLHWSVLIPAVLLIILPWLGVRIVHVIIVSSAAAFLLAVGVQQQPFATVLVDCIVGYHPSSPLLQDVFSGGGVMSMLNVMCIILLSNGCASIFQETNLLRNVQGRIEALLHRWGFFPAQIMLAFFLSSIFCNQTIGIILSTQLTSGIYDKQGLSRQQLAADLNNSIITIAALIPWSIAGALPLSVLHVGPAALGYSIWLYLVPLCYLLTRSKKLSRSDVR